MEQLALSFDAPADTRRYVRVQCELDGYRWSHIVDESSAERVIEEQRELGVTAIVKGAA